ncbi:hypothetical protein AB6896_01750 [Rahnella inusitata]|uniref:hypothetical protein n=1 Tax=Rahnella inusitata TaxID=58169 RepID=UPI0039BDC141
MTDTTDTAVQDMPEFTEGICGDEVVILCDGQRMSISNILAQLNAGAAAEARVKELERQKPVVLPHGYKPYLVRSQTTATRAAMTSGGEWLHRDEVTSAIEAAGGIVKDGE